MKDKIKLESRYRGDENYLIRIGDSSSKRFMLHTDYNYRVGLIDGNPDIYDFVDPSGGPFIQKGTKIEGSIVKSISKGNEGIIIEFE